MATKKKTTKKKATKKKIDSIPKINRKLFTLWSLAVRERADHSCEYCGIKKGTLNKNDKPTKIDAHHLMNRDVSGSPLKFDIRNGIALCPRCHKWSPNDAFHSNPITTVSWLIKNNDPRYNFVLENYDKKIDLQSREILDIIKDHLEKKEPLDIPNLEEITERIEKEKEEKSKEKEEQAKKEDVSIFDNLPEMPEMPEIKEDD